MKLKKIWFARQICHRCHDKERRYHANVSRLLSILPHFGNVPSIFSCVQEILTQIQMHVLHKYVTGMDLVLTKTIVIWYLVVFYKNNKKPITVGHCCCQTFKNHVSHVKTQDVLYWWFSFPPTFRIMWEIRNKQPCRNRNWNFT